MERRTPIRQRATSCPECARRNLTLCTGHAPIERSTPLPQRNEERQQRRAEEDRVYGSYHRWIGTLPCELWSHPEHRCQPGTVKGHHDVPVGRGGEDYENEIPLCAIAHLKSPKAIHNMARSDWQAFWGIDIDARKASYARRYDAGERAA